jgi:hypothetical protein
VVSFKPLLLYPRRKNPRYPLDRRLGGSHGRFGQYGEVKILDPTGTRFPAPLQSVAIRYADCATAALHVLNCDDVNDGHSASGGLRHELSSPAPTLRS